MKVRVYSNRLDILDAMQTMTSGWTRRRHSLEYASVNRKTVKWLKSLMVSMSTKFDARVMVDVIEDA